MKTLFTTITAALLSSTAVQAGEAVTYQVGDQTFEGYVATTSEPRGTIIVLPTWHGLSDYEMDRAEMLAELGFTAFAADLYPAGQRPETMSERQAGLQSTVTDQNRMQEMLRGAVDQARALGDGPLIVLGYSMGAIVAMEMAWSGLGNQEDVAGYVIFSGRVSDNFGRLMPDGVAPFFVAHGEADTQVQVSGLVNFRDDVDMSGGRVVAHVYPGAGHLFSAFGFPNYNAEADALSWSALQAFFDDIVVPRA